MTSEFLDTCLNMFFNRFIPSFPVMQRSTFVSKDCAHPLLLNIIALGSLFVAAPAAIRKVCTFEDGSRPRLTLQRVNVYGDLHILRSLHQ